MTHEAKKSDIMCHFVTIEIYICLIIDSDTKESRDYFAEDLFILSTYA